MQITALILGVLGTFFSIGRSRWCFVIWTFPNVFWTWYNWTGGERIQAGVFAVMTFSCLVGWLVWGLDSERAKLLKFMDDRAISKLTEENEALRQGWNIAQNQISRLQKELRACRN